MRFTHTADCHIGGHRNPKLRQLTEDAFAQFVKGTIDENVDFCLIAGDLFDTALPGIDALKFTVTQLGLLKEQQIPVYIIPGSHDYSPSGKTMLDVLEKAGLLVNVFKHENGKLIFTKDKTGILLTGILGRRGALDKELFKTLTLPDEQGEKIFLFHAALEGLTPENIPGQPLSLLPEGCKYYAGGHVHIVKRYNDEKYKNVVYPGPLFPNSFSELEELEHGGYFLYDGDLTRKDIVLKPVKKLLVDVDGMTVEQANLKLAETQDVNNAIVLLRIHGTLASGSPADVAVRKTAERLEETAYVVLRNTARLTSEEFEQRVIERDHPGDIEEELLQEHKDQLALEGKDGATVAKQLLKTLSRELKDGERKYEYEEAVVKEGIEALK